jgi:hypothetical protein
LFVNANTPHPLDPRTEYPTAALRITAWKAEPTRRTDPLWSATPEAERAFLNAEGFLEEFAEGAPS